MDRLLPTAFITLVLALLPAAQAAPDAMPAGIAWKQAHEVDAAFAQTKKENRPLFLYWGAVWCPPCNQVKATVFSRADFIERARLFVPVYIDGDAPAAQKLGARFKASGYPTMILFRPDGSEITRLPGEVEPAQVMAVLALGLAEGRPVKAVLADANEQLFKPWILFPKPIFVAANGPAIGAPVTSATLTDGIIADILADAAKRGAKRPAVIGHSYGGLIGMMLAARHPDRYHDREHAGPRRKHGAGHNDERCGHGQHRAQADHQPGRAGSGDCQMAGRDPDLLPFARR